MAKQNTIEITIEGNNVTAIRAIDGTETKLKGLGNTAKQQSSIVENMFGSISTIAATAGIALSAEALISFGKDAVMASAQLDVLRSNFIGTKGDIELFQKATAGTVSEASLIKLSNQASDLGLTMQQQAILLSLAEDAADKYGGSVEDNFSRVLKASEGATKGLKELGIQKAEYDAIVKKYVEQYGAKQLSQLDAETQKWIQVQSVIDAAGVSIGDVANKMPDLADKFDQVTARWENLKASIGSSLTEIGNSTFFLLTEMIGGKSLMEAISNLQNYQTELSLVKQYQDSLKEQAKESNTKPPGIITSTIDESKKLIKEWESISNAILQENTLFGLNEFEKKEQQLIFKANELRQKFYQIPGALDLINFNLSQKLAELYTPDETALRKMQQSFQLPELNKSFSIAPAVDVTGMTANMDLIKSKMGEISAESAIHFGLIEMAGTDAFGMMGDALMQFSELSDNKHKELFVAAKAFSIAQAIMNTYEGATKALAQGGIFGYVSAAAIIATGMANVARIASTQPGTSRGSGGGVSSTRTSFSDSAIRSVQNQNTTNNNNARTVTFIFNGDVVDPDQWFRKNKSAIQKLFNDGIITANNG